MAWTLADIRTKVRELTGRSATADLSDAAANSYINDYMRYDFPVEVQLDHLDSTWSQELTPTDDGEYALSDDIIELTEPIMLNGDEELLVWFDQEEFWRLYPANEGYISAPTLVVGTTNAAHVSISGYQYSKAAAETALSGDAVPQSKYGAWMLSLDADGTVTITAASGNATGYSTPGRAVGGIATADITDAIMGFVTAICSSGAFTPGTTELNTGANVTATFTDGHPDLRGRPTSILCSRSENKVYVRPKPDDSGRLAAADGPVRRYQHAVGRILGPGPGAGCVGQVPDEQRAQFSAHRGTDERARRYPRPRLPAL
jgi:hypothetical protein